MYLNCPNSVANREVTNATDAGAAACGTDGAPSCDAVRWALGLALPAPGAEAVRWAANRFVLCTCNRFFWPNLGQTLQKILNSSNF